MSFSSLFLTDKHILWFKNASVASSPQNLINCSNVKNLHLVLRCPKYLGSNPAGTPTCNFFTSTILFSRGTQFHPIYMRQKIFQLGWEVEGEGEV